MNEAITLLMGCTIILAVTLMGGWCYVILQKINSNIEMLIKIIEKWEEKQKE